MALSTNGDARVATLHSDGSLRIWTTQPYHAFAIAMKPQRRATNNNDDVSGNNRAESTLVDVAPHWELGLRGMGVGRSGGIN